MNILISKIIWYELWQPAFIFNIFLIYLKIVVVVFKQFYFDNLNSRFNQYEYDYMNVSVSSWHLKNLLSLHKSKMLFPCFWNFRNARLECFRLIFYVYLITKSKFIVDWLQINLFLKYILCLNFLSHRNKN